MQSEVESDISLQLRVGRPLGQGTSGVVSPIVSSIDGGTYVVKEVAYEQSEEEHVLREVRLHRLCSAGSRGIVRYSFAFSAVSLSGEARRLQVLMEACAGDLWDVVTGSSGCESIAPTPRRSLPLSRSSSREGYATSSRRPSASRPPLSPSYLTTPVAFEGCSRRPATCDRPTRTERRCWTRTLCEALRHCHSLRVMHRDVNPWNVLMAADRDGSCRAVRLADFGLAVQLPSGTEELVGEEFTGATPLDASALGSLYSAPELGIRYGFAADVFSLGMTLLAIWYSAGKQASIASTDENVDGLVTLLELVKDNAKQGLPPPAGILTELEACGNPDADIRILILRMISSKPEDRPTLEEACGFCERYMHESPAERGSAKAKVLGRDKKSAAKDHVISVLGALDDGGAGRLCGKQLAHLMHRLGGFETDGDGRDVYNQVQQLYEASQTLGDDGRVDYRAFISWIYCG